MAGHAMNHEASLPYAPTKRLLAPATEKSLGLHRGHQPVFGVAGRERQLDAERLKREERHGGTLALLEVALDGRGHERNCHASLIDRIGEPSQARAPPYGRFFNVLSSVGKSSDGMISVSSRPISMHRGALSRSACDSRNRSSACRSDGSA